MLGVILSSVIGVAALIIAVFSMRYAKQQVDLSKSTKSDTEKLLKQIDSRVKELKSLTRIIKQNVEETVRDLIQNNNENLKTLIEKLTDRKESSDFTKSEQSMQDKALEQALPGIITMAMEDPEKFQKFISTVEGLDKK